LKKSAHELTQLARKFGNKWRRISNDGRMAALTEGGEPKKAA
jgi:hypothetical protein